LKVNVLLAPEVLAEKGYSLPSDIFSWAVLCWESFGLDRFNPFCGMDQAEALEEVTY